MRRTAGPWEIDAYGNIKDSSGETIRVNGVALPSGWTDSEDECYGNANLVIAAPDLAKHADDLLQLLHGDDDVCRAYGVFLSSLREEERKEVEAALDGLQEALYKADGE